MNVKAFKREMKIKKFKRALNIHNLDVDTFGNFLIISLGTALTLHLIVQHYYATEIALLLTQ